MIKFIIAIIIIIWGIIWLFKKYQHNSNVLKAINNRKIIRRLTQDEYQQLTLYLDDIKKVRYYKKSLSLIDNKVSIVSGDYSFFSSSKYFVCLIGGVKCIVADNLSDYLTDNNNILQVVFTRGYAVAVAVNGHNCIAAKVIDEAMIVHQQCWFEGQKGSFAVLTQHDINYIESQDEQLQLSVLQQRLENKSACCEIIAQREQTVYEKARKNYQNSGFMSIVCFGFSLLMLSNKPSAVVLFLSCIALIASIVLYFFKSVKFDKVNHIKDSVEFNDIGYCLFITQSRLLISYPDYWKEFLPYQKLQNVDMDVTVGKIYWDEDIDLYDESTATSNIGDIQLLRYGDRLSINDEIKWYGRPKFWGRNCVILVVALFSHGCCFCQH